MRYAYLVGSAALMLIWLALWLHAHTTVRSVILRVSVLTGLSGLTEPLFVPAYWDPPTLFDLGHRTGFDIESLLFSFAFGGIATAIYGGLYTIRQIRATAAAQRSSHQRFHLFALAVFPLVFVALAATTNVNPIYITIVALCAGALATCLCRPDLIRNMIASGLVFLGLYFVWFSITFNMRYVGQVWNLRAMSGVVIIGVPMEELLFAFAYGLMLCSITEYSTRVIVNRTDDEI